MAMEYLRGLSEVVASYLCDMSDEGASRLVEVVAWGMMDDSIELRLMALAAIGAVATRYSVRAESVRKEQGERMTLMAAARCDLIVVDERVLVSAMASPSDAEGLLSRLRIQAAENIRDGRVLAAQPLENEQRGVENYLIAMVGRK